MEKELTPEEIRKQKSKASRDARKARKKTEGNTSKEEIEDEEEKEEEEIEEKVILITSNDQESIHIEEIKIEEVEKILEVKNVEVIDQSTLTENKDHLKELSPMAKKWKAYIQYNKLDLHTFLDKYPRHKFRNFIEEIIEFEKNNSI